VRETPLKGITKIVFLVKRLGVTLMGTASRYHHIYMFYLVEGDITTFILFIKKSRSLLYEKIIVGMLLRNSEGERLL
jgi:hypothetical protein